MTTTIPAHPAAFSDGLLPVLGAEIDEYAVHKHTLRVLDPFAGVGRAFELPAYCHRRLDITGLEIEPEWAAARNMVVGDATAMDPKWTRRFDVIVTSPCYGNRMADHHEPGSTGRDTCTACNGHDPASCKKCKGTGLTVRRTYRGALGRMPSEGSAATMQWGDAYRTLHEAAWREAWRVLRPDGIFVLNVKDHVRGGERQRVSAWHRRTVEAIGFIRVATTPIKLGGYRHGRNHDSRMDREYVFTFRRP